MLAYGLEPIIGKPPQVEINAMEIVGGIDLMVSAIGSAPR